MRLSKEYNGPQNYFFAKEIYWVQQNFAKKTQKTFKIQDFEYEFGHQNTIKDDQFEIM